jgi:CheY-like chemotaxis protein
MRTPLLNVRRDPVADKRRRRTLFLAGLGVFVACLVITLAVFFAMRAFETNEAKAAFEQVADDSANTGLEGGRDKNRAIRSKIGAAFRHEIEALGTLPSREWFNRQASRGRSDPTAVPIIRISFNPNIAASERPRFEAAMSRLAKRNVSISVPGLGPPVPSPEAPFYMPVLYSDTGTEALTGPTLGYVGQNWLDWNPSISDVINRSTQLARVLQTEPTYAGNDRSSQNAHASYTYGFSPVFVNPAQFEQWCPGATQGDVSIIVCENGPCDPSYRRCPPDPRASFVITGRLVDAPVHGLLVANNKSRAAKMAGKGELVPLCVPARSFVPGTNYSGYTNLTADPSLTGPCEPRRKQAMTAQAAPLAIETRSLLQIGTLAFVKASGIIAVRALRSLPANKQILIATEDIDDSEEWPFTLRTWKQDSVVTAAPVASWVSEVKANGFVPPPQLPLTSRVAEREVEIKGKGDSQLTFEPSIFNPATWRVVKGPSFPTADGDFVFGLHGGYAKNRVTQPCVNESFHGSASEYVTLCPPNIPKAEYLRLRAKFKFTASFVGLVGGRLWRYEVASLEPYYVDHTNSHNALIGGLVLSAVLVVIVVSILSARDQHIQKRQRKAAEGAHTLVVDYCVSEVKHCNDGLVFQLGALQKNLPALAATDKQLQEATAALATAPVVSMEASARDDVGDESEELLSRSERIERVKQVRTARARLLQLYAMMDLAFQQLTDDVAAMETRAEQLHEISNDFSDYSKLRAGHFEVRHKLVELRAVISRAVDACSVSTVVGLHPKLSPSLPSHALIDPLRVQQILINGLSNAAGYSRDIEMTISCLGDDGMVQHLSEVPVPSWYKLNKPNLQALMLQVGYTLPEQLTGGNMGNETPAGSRRRCPLPSRKSQQHVPAELPPSFLAIAEQHREKVGSVTGHSGLSAQFLVMEITHRTPAGPAQQQRTGSNSTNGGQLKPRKASLWSRLRCTSTSNRAGDAPSEVEMTVLPGQGADAPASGHSSASANGTGILPVATSANLEGIQQPPPAQEQLPSSDAIRQANSSFRDVTLNGTSIGLALSSSLVERLEGWIALYDEPDPTISGTKVTRFSVILPCWVANREGAAAMAATGGPASVETEQEASLSPTTNHELSLIETRASGRHNLWSVETLSPVAAAQPLAGIDSSPPVPDTSAASPAPTMLSQPIAAPSPVSSRTSAVIPASSRPGGSPPLMSAAASAPRPGNTTATAPSPVAPRPLSRTTVAHVLVADDDEVNRRLAKRMLQRIHCSCDTIDDVKLAAVCFERTGQLRRSTLSSPSPARHPLPADLTDPPRPYDFALFDIFCGESLGWEACQQLKAQGLRNVPVFAMTGNTDPSELQTYRDAGMEDLVLGKPFTVEALEKVLEVVLEKKSSV